MADLFGRTKRRVAEGKKQRREEKRLKRLKKGSEPIQSETAAFDPILPAAETPPETT